MLPSVVTAVPKAFALSNMFVNNAVKGFIAIVIAKRVFIAVNNSNTFEYCLYYYLSVKHWFKKHKQ